MALNLYEVHGGYLRNGLVIVQQSCILPDKLIWPIVFFRWAIIPVGAFFRRKAPLPMGYHEVIAEGVRQGDPRPDEASKAFFVMIPQPRDDERLAREIAAPREIAAGGVEKVGAEIDNAVELCTKANALDVQPHVLRMRNLNRPPV